LLLKVNIDEAFLHYPVFQTQHKKVINQLQEVKEKPVVDLYIHKQKIYIVSKILEVIYWYLQGNKEIIGVAISEQKLFEHYCTTPKFLEITSCFITDIIDLK
jgi:hypothetical protein